MAASVIAPPMPCRWYNGKIFISDRDELTRAYDAFEEWRREKGLEDRKIASYSIVGEKATRSLEPLLVNPVGRPAVVLGKWAAVACVGMGSKLITKERVAGQDYAGIADAVRDAFDPRLNRSEGTA